MSREVMQQALDMLNEIADHVYFDQKLEGVITALEQALEEKREPVAWASSLDFDDDDIEIIPARAKGKLGTSNCDIPLYTAPQKPLILSMEEAVAAGDAVLMNEQASLLRECRAALDSLIAQKPTLAGLLCGSTTLGNLKAELHAYRPQGVFGSAQSIKEKNI